MKTLQIAQISSIVVGAVTALSLVSKHPVHIGILAVCAGVYILAPKILK